jgi:glycosyltransferase involved in cell wall biosynthesis
LIETVKLAEIKYPGKYRWRFAGNGPDYEDQLRQLSKRPGSSMEFLGYLDATELIKLQKSADLLIQLRARDQSPLGVYSFRYQPALKFIEYLLTGKPILTTDFPAIDTEMRPFLNFIDSNDPEDILAAIERICEHPPSQKLLKQGRDYVIEHHSASAVARELKTILEQIV